jgi:hypothetical protein
LEETHLTLEMKRVLPARSQCIDWAMSGSIEQIEVGKSGTMSGKREGTTNPFSGILAK